jgi:purine nucleosidase
MKCFGGKMKSIRNAQKLLKRAFPGLMLTLIACAPAIAAPRPVAPWPPPSGPLRLIIDTDTGNEVDDQYALALALGEPSRLHLEGIVAANFGETGGVAGIDKSYQEIQQVLEKAGMSGKVPVKRGADPLVYRDEVVHSEGVDFIIEKARSATPEAPLWLVLLGPATDAAAALLKDPTIADRLVVFWHGRTQWPLRCWNFNAYNDILAARLLFELQCRLVLFDTGTYLRIDPDEDMRRFGSLGPLGAYLQEIRHRRPAYMSPNKGVFDLGDIAALVDPSTVRWEKVDAPAVTQDLQYNFAKNYGQIIRIHWVEPEPVFQLLEEALRRIQESAAKPAK